MPHRPVIGVTGSEGRGRLLWLFLWLAVRRAGGHAVRLTAARHRRLPDCAGLIVGGGDDIGLEIEDAEIRPIQRTDPARDHFEIEALAGAKQRDLPILGICRGAQMLALANDGSIHTEITEAYPALVPIRTVLPKKRVSLSPGSRLAAILGSETIAVNALHHQSIDRPGTGFVISARDDYGIAQGIEGQDPESPLSVQWHPELLVFSRSQQALFRDLIRRARAGRTPPQGMQDRAGDPVGVAGS